MPTINIELTSQQYDALCKGESITINQPEASKPKQWEPAGGDYLINSAGAVLNYSGTSKCKSFGVLRKTKEQAEKARDEMQQFNRLLAYRDEFDPDYVARWNCEDEMKYHVYYNHPAKKWNITSGQTCNYPEVVYMSRDVAIELAKKLNSGEVVL